MWKLKVLIQWLLAGLPKGEAINHLLQRARGSLSYDNIAARIPEMAREFDRVNKQVSLSGVIVVEIGTGWDAIATLMMYMMGAATIYTFDHVRHMRYGLVRHVLNALQARMGEVQAITGIALAVLQERLDRLKPASNLDDLLQRAGIVYRAPADATATALPGRSVDVVFSYGVLEHVSEAVLTNLMEESRRILKPNGIAYHTIGLGDHYAREGKVSGVNFLKYPEGLWRFFVKNNISYHNRLRERQFLDIFRGLGAQPTVVVHTIHPGDLEALKTMKVHKDFAGMTAQELAVFSTSIVLRFDEAVAAAPSNPQA